MNEQDYIRENSSCPGCGQKYGHHNTKVDKISEECSSCVKKAGYKNTEFIDASEFVGIIMQTL